MTQIVPTVGLARVSLIANNDTSHVAVGTGVNAPAIGDTQLQTETNRRGVTSRIQQNAIFESRAFFPNADLPATTREVGWFMNGTGDPDTGSLLFRASTNFVKGSQDLLLILEVTFSES